ncbi:F-box protein At4g18380-like [Juglans microcarpa x Juglans regia]|uniref:F-box protein At4g18380-like n=1 Tax=Juglans microcarpa x Juglans regia TaxID=2249226 RepID=UPI001B7E765B|nr:F-box protein At4g18380-like [Juglans microcarpa x Juglans regia]
MDSNQEDHFDRLPDAIPLLICNKLLDAKTLIRCLSVSKRFASLISQIDTVFLPLPRVVPDPKPRGGLPKKVFKVFVQNLVTKHVRFLHHIISARHAKNLKPNHFLYHSPCGVLKNFNGVKTLHLELPCIGCDMEFDGGDHSLRLLKWKAEFGEELKCCVILGATSFERKKLSSTNSTTGNEVRDEEEQEQECFQYLLKEIVAKCCTLQRVVVTDVSKQWKLCMAEEHIVELRNIITMTRWGCCRRGLQYQIRA